MTSQRIERAWRGVLGEDQEPLKAAIVLLIAVFTFLATVLAALQVEAGIRAAMAGRVADTIDAAATGQRSEGLIQTNTDLGVYRRWIELTFDRSWASDVAESGTGGPADGIGDAPDPELAAEIARIDAELADWARRQSPLLQPPYWDDDGFSTDIAALDGERNIAPQARATHERRIAQAEAEDRGARAADYVTTITLVAVGLFFLGLAAALAGAARRILGIAGVCFGLVALLAGASIALRPVDRVPATAVDELVAAEVSLARVAWAATPGVVDEADRSNYDAAIAATDRAVRDAPDYAPARLARAEARLAFATDLLLALEPDPTTAGPLLDAALADFRQYTDEDASSYRAWWNLGWAAYLAGDEATSVTATDEALRLAPGQFTLYLNRAVARLAAGDASGARADAATAIEVAVRERLDSNGWFFAQTDYNMARLAAARPDEADELLAIQRRIREAAVGSRIGRPQPVAEMAVDLGLTTVGLERGRLVEGGHVDAGAAVDQSGVAGFRVTLGGRGVPDGAILSIRVHVGGFEAPAYRIDRPWPDTASETAVDLVSPYGRMGFEVDPGEYEVEAFIDGRTVARLPLTVAPGMNLRMTATELTSFLSGGGMTCAEPEVTEAATTTTCLTTGATRDTGMEAMIVAGDGGAIDAFELGSPDLEPARALVRQMIGIAGSLLFDPDEAADLEAWATSAEPGDTTTVAGWRFAASGAGERFTIRGERP